MQVSGKAFLGLVKHIRDTRGPSKLKRIGDIGGTRVAAILGSTIRSLSWYEYPTFVDFLLAADSVLGSGDLSMCRTLGREAGKRDLNSIYKLMLRLRNPERLIMSCSRVWESYYRDAGRMIAVETSPHGTILRIVDFPAMHPAHCRLMEGWMIQAMESIGCTVSEDACESRCMSRGHKFHEFVCTWSMPKS